MSFKSSRAFLVVFLILIGVSYAHAATVGWGVAVSGAGSSQQVGLPIQSYDSTPDGVANATPNWIKYYVPLSGKDSGIYGVTDTNSAGPCVQGSDCAGTFADIGTGNSYLDMFLKFAPVAQLPLADAHLTFEFSDLDLAYVNDPAGFFESAQLFSASGSALSPKFTQALATDTTGSVNGINWELKRTAGSAGASAPVYLDFWGAGLTALISGPFWAELEFKIPTVSIGLNTPEYVRGSLTTTSRVPEPGTLMLLLISAVVTSYSAFRKATTLS